MGRSSVEERFHLLCPGSGWFSPQTTICSLRRSARPRLREVVSHFAVSLSVWPALAFMSATSVSGSSPGAMSISRKFSLLKQRNTCGWGKMFGVKVLNEKRDGGVSQCVTHGWLWTGAVSSAVLSISCYTKGFMSFSLVQSKTMFVVVKYVFWDKKTVAAAAESIKWFGEGYWRTRGVMKSWTDRQDRWTDPDKDGWRSSPRKSEPLIPHDKPRLGSSQCYSPALVSSLRLQSLSIAFKNGDGRLLKTI